MSKYLKIFETTSEYEAYKNSEEYILPNISCIKENNSIYAEPRKEENEDKLEYHFNMKFSIFTHFLLY